jgi:hypothetical protein
MRSLLSRVTGRMAPATRRRAISNATTAFSRTGRGSRTVGGSTSHEK